LFIVVIILSVIAALRFFGYDRDYFSYLKFYERTSFGGYDSRFEPGFEFAARVSNFVLGPDSFVLFLFAVAFVSLYLKLSIISRVRYFPFLVLVYSMLIYPLHEMMQIRVGLASGVVFYALYLCTSSGLSFFKKILWVFLGVSLHYSVIVVAPFILFTELFFKRSVLMLILISTMPALLIYISIDILRSFIPIVEYYLTQEDFVNPYSSRNIVFIIILGLVFLNFRNIPAYSFPWICMSFLGIGLFFGLISIPVFAHRFLELSIFPYLIWVPSLPKIPKIIALSLLFVFSTYFLYRAFFISPFFMSPLTT
jgi:hypothetical protein